MYVKKMLNRKVNISDGKYTIFFHNGRIVWPVELQGFIVGDDLLESSRRPHVQALPFCLSVRFDRK